MATPAGQEANIKSTFVGTKKGPQEKLWKDKYEDIQKVAQLILLGLPKAAASPEQTSTET